MNNKLVKKIRRIAMLSAAPKEPLAVYVRNKPPTEGTMGTLMLHPGCTRGRFKRIKKAVGQLNASSRSLFRRKPIEGFCEHLNPHQG
ncbi:MAG: hypothetical protein HQL93_13005 [Magnetococcales bacterium]|nr:hypothetical protein [Magnetococcales bacterium]